jgi:anti-sigma factor RsiW
MNCFEARQDFRSFWRRELQPERRAAFNQHLSGCLKCDWAFRQFALSAPALHSETGPDRSGEISRPPVQMLPRRSGAGFRETRSSSQWLSMAAAAVLFVTGASAAYFSVAGQNQSLSDAMHQPDPVVQLVSSDLPPANSDLGQ